MLHFVGKRVAYGGKVGRCLRGTWPLKAADVVWVKACPVGLLLFPSWPPAERSSGVHQTVSGHHDAFASADVAAVMVCRVKRVSSDLFKIELLVVSPHAGRSEDFLGFPYPLGKRLASLLLGNPVLQDGLSVDVVDFKRFLALWAVEYGSGLVHVRLVLGDDVALLVDDHGANLDDLAGSQAGGFCVEDDLWCLKKIHDTNQ